jgi:glycerophosphoryl diester phosphodiesterase
MNTRSKTYPRVVAHRGFSKACPENTLPAFGAAVALGADEIEFDIWPSADGELVIIHDPSLHRTTDKTGVVKELNWIDIASADAGVKFGEQWRAVRVPRLEDVWGAFAGQMEFNIHIKDPGEDGFVVREVKQLAEKYGIVDQIYVAGIHDVMECMLQYAPEIERCCLNGQNGWNLVDKGIEYKCGRVQFANRFCDEEQISKAHDAGIICNLFYADDPDEAARYYEMGIDSILTNALAEVLPVVRKRKQLAA